MRPGQSYPLFLDLTPAAPSTREIADIVKRGGADALTDA